MNKFIFLLLIFFYASASFAADVWQKWGGAYPSQADATAVCDMLENDNSANNPPRAWRVQAINSWQYGCYYNSNPCDLPEIWDSVRKECREPCPTGDAGFLTFPPNVWLVCYGGCAITQNGNSHCTGALIDGGTCTQRFTYTGSFCPNPPSTGESSAQPANPNSHPDQDSWTGGGDSGGDNGGGDSGGGNNGGGDTGGGDSGGGCVGSGCDVINPNPDGGSGGNGGSGDGGSGGDGNGYEDNGIGNADVGGGGSCDAPPVCTSADNDSVTCAILKQQWLARCPITEGVPFGAGTDGLYEGDGEHTLNIYDRLATAEQKYADKFNEIASDIQDQLSLSVGGGGGGLPCNPQQIFGVSVELGICARSDFFSLISGIFYAVATVLSAYIVLGKN
jgi:hypothetical protein